MCIRTTSHRTVLALAAAAALPISAYAQDKTPPADGQSAQDQALLDRIAALEKQLAEVQSAADQAALQQMLLEARVQAGESGQGDQIEPNKTFSSGQRALQAMNPELSAVIDTGLQMGMVGGATESIEDSSQFYFRLIGLHFESNLDPFSFFKAAIGATPSGVGLGEAYVTRTRVLPGTSLTVGKFRQQFGVINRWHAPSMDQFDRPLVMSTLLSGEGLNAIGASADIFLPPWWAHSSKLTVQVTNGNNGQLFSADYATLPVVLGRLSNYYDLSDETYMELGLSGMQGVNNDPSRAAATVQTVEVPAYDVNGDAITLYDENGEVIGAATATVTQEVPGDPVRRQTWLGGADLTVSWSPLNGQRYKNVTWRSEGFWVHKDTPDGIISAKGLYSYVDWRLSEKWVVGGRVDVTQPFAVDNDELLWQGVGYLTWWQSPWVKARLQLSHMQGSDAMVDPVDRLTVQIVTAAGPHKHERY